MRLILGPLRPACRRRPARTSLGRILSGDGSGPREEDARGRRRHREPNGKLDITPIPGSAFTLDADLVLLAMGLVGPERGGMLDALRVRMSDGGNVWRELPALLQ